MRPVTPIFAAIDDVLRSGRHHRPRPDARPATVFAMCIACAVAYGAAMGCSGEVVAGRPLQVLYSMLKLPALLILAFALSLPSFFVLNMLLGVRDDFADVLRALLSAQAALAIVLLSLSPLTLLWYLSMNHHEADIAFNAIIFSVAAISGQGVLRRHYRTLIALRPVHAHLLRIWLIVYAFVGIQAAWVLRPFIGDPGRPTEFFRHDAWGNAYIWLAKMTCRLLFHPD